MIRILNSLFNIELQRQTLFFMNRGTEMVLKKKEAQIFILYRLSFSIESYNMQTALISI